MCDFCEKEKTILEEEVIKGSTLAFGGPVDPKDLWRFEYKLGVFIDTRGYLRLADLDDCQCLDGGKKTKINFCPICGTKVTQEC